ncbi:hypothetical protein [Geomonas propionica]|uniref:ABC transporter ATP-binding protein n=1 Tax=Geomonas propionica TaxID=2798582 RepID=A0ABS0YM19_9BACT|nr:hypothetical protein [Geomonas propionica]MBJ6799023.1 hypothetical protein [Geomonas propionica]
MNDLSKDVLLDDPLSEETRKERKILLGVSLIGIAMAKAGIVPTKISILGIELESAKQGVLLYLAAFIVIYYILAFSIYATSDFIAHRKRISLFYVKNVQLFMDLISEPNRDKSEYEFLLNETKDNLRFWKTLSPIACVIRSAFEFILPVLISVYAVYVLIILAIQKA